MRPPTGETLEAFVNEVIVPPGDKIRGRFDFSVPVLHTVGFPEIVKSVVSDHLSIERTIPDAVKAEISGSRR